MAIIELVNASSAARGAEGGKGEGGGRSIVSQGWGNYSGKQGSLLRSRRNNSYYNYTHTQRDDAATELMLCVCLCVCGGVRAVT